jgi:hypothetical protein
MTQSTLVPGVPGMRRPSIGVVVTVPKKPACRARLGGTVFMARAAHVTHDLRVLRAVSRVSNDLATSRADARKRSTTGLSVRFLSVAMTTGHG